MREYASDAERAVHGDVNVDVCVEVSSDVQRVGWWSEWVQVFVAGVNCESEAFGVDVALEVS